MASKPRTYNGNPETCNVCECRIKLVFVDGATRMGPWMLMCPTCHKQQGGRLGLGMGQRFEKSQIDGEIVWVKTAG